MKANLLIRRFLWACSAVVLLAGLTGCPFNPPRDLTGSGMDMFCPITMRLHPLSRLTVSEGVGQLEAHVEFTDQMGDVTKGVGAVQVALFAYDDFAILTHKGRELGSWAFDLSTPQVNKAAWDPITRTYVLRRETPAGTALPSGRQFVLSATFTLPNGQSLQDDLLLKIK